MIDRIKQRQVELKQAEAEAEARMEPEVSAISRAAGGAEMFIAKVVSDAAGAGVYNCYIQKLDATNWGNSSAVSINKNTDSVAVLNMAEDAATSHNLDAGDYILCWKMTDDEGNSRYVGNEIIGRYTFGVW